MDKQTLSNYGWIVICILVLSVMIAMATPFGKFIAEGVKSTTQGLFDVNQKAFNNVGLGQVPDQEFEDHYSGNGTGGGAQVSAPGATFSKYLTSPGCHTHTYQHTDSCYTAEINTLTWDELKLAENGTKYGYKVSKITDTAIGYEAFRYCISLTSMVIPKGIKSIEGCAFDSCTSLTTIKLPDSLTTLKHQTFYNCTSLTSIDLPDSLTSIGINSFTDCPFLASVDFANPSGWTYGGTALSAEDLANSSTAATYLKSYGYKEWNRS